MFKVFNDRLNNWSQFHASFFHIKHAHVFGMMRRSSNSEDVGNCRWRGIEQNFHLLLHRSGHEPGG